MKQTNFTDKLFQDEDDKLEAQLEMQREKNRKQGKNHRRVVSLPIPHIKYSGKPCGGTLTFSHKMKDKYGRTKQMFRCSKCKDLVSIITMSSYNEMKSNGMIK